MAANKKRPYKSPKKMNTGSVVCVTYGPKQLLHEVKS